MSRDKSKIDIDIKNLFLIDSENKYFLEGDLQRLPQRISQKIGGGCLLIALPCLLFFLGFFLAHAWVHYQEWKYFAVTLEETAVIEKIEENRWNKFLLAENTARVFYTFTYKENGEEKKFSGKQIIHIGKYKIGDSLPVMFSQSRPDISFVGPGREQIPWGFMLVVLLLSLLGISFLWKSLFPWWKIRTLEKKGKILPGEIIRSSISENEKVITILCSLSQDSSKERTFRQSFLRLTVDNLPNKGAQVAILHHTDQLFKIL